MFPKPQKATVSLVADLKQGKQWNEQFLDELFSTVKFAAVKMIPIREWICHDRWVCQYTSKGNFIVILAYHVQTFVEQPGANSSSLLSMGVSAKTWKGY